METRPEDTARMAHFPLPTGQEIAFAAYGLAERPGGQLVVYGFAKRIGEAFQPLYFGVADNLPARLAGHERLSEAVFLGADFLLVFGVAGATRPYVEAIEAQLIDEYRPELNFRYWN